MAYGMQQPAQAPGPQAAGNMPKQNINTPGGLMRAKESVLNPTDMVGKMNRGQVRPDMSIREFIENNLGVSVDAPVTALAESMARQVQNKDMAGKMKGMRGLGGGMPKQPSMPTQPGRPNPGMQQKPQGADMGSIMNSLR